MIGTAPKGRRRRSFRGGVEGRTHATNKEGGVAEWTKAHAWRACRRATVSRVQIPAPPLMKRMFKRDKTGTNPDEVHMDAALREARRAIDRADVPVGAVVVDEE